MNYHFKNNSCCNFLVLSFQKFFELVQVIFILFFTVYLIDGVDYEKLFNVHGTSEKVKLVDVLKPITECLSNMSFQVMKKKSS